MPRFCTQCGKRLSDTEKFCTNCGTPAPTDGPQAAAPEEAGTEKPGATPSASATTADSDKTVVQASTQPTRQLDCNGPSPAMDPGTTQRWAAANPQPVTPSEHIRQTNAGNAAQQPRKTGPVVAALVIVVALAIAGIVIFAINPLGSDTDAQDAKIEKTKHASVTEDEQAPQGDPNSLDDDDDDDADDNTQTISERNIYRQLDSHYSRLADLDQQVRDCAATFNQDYLKEDYSVRQSSAGIAESLEDQIEDLHDEAEDLDVPLSSQNYRSWKDIVALFDDLDHRIEAICDAWDISLRYDTPADHQDEIVAPLAKDNVAGTNDNKYRLDYEERYDGAKPTEVE